MCFASKCVFITFPDIPVEIWSHQTRKSSPWTTTLIPRSLEQTEHGHAAPRPAWTTLRWVLPSLGPPLAGPANMSLFFPLPTTFVFLSCELCVSPSVQCARDFRVSTARSTSEPYPVELRVALSRHTLMLVTTLQLKISRRPVVVPSADFRRGKTKKKLTRVCLSLLSREVRPSSALRFFALLFVPVPTRVLNCQLHVHCCRKGGILLCRCLFWQRLRHTWRGDESRERLPHLGIHSVPTC